MKIKLTIDGTTAFKAEVRPEAFSDAMVDIAPHMAKVLEAYAKLMADTAPAFAEMAKAFEAAVDAAEDTLEENGGLTSVFIIDAGDTDTCYIPECGDSVENGSRFCSEHECSVLDCHRVSIGGDDNLCHAHATAAGTNPFASDFGIKK